MNIKGEGDLEEWLTKRILSAIRIRDVMSKEFHIRPQFRLYASNKVSLNMAQYKEHKKLVNALAKRFHIFFKKEVTSQGFLKYVGIAENEVRVMINTRDCFYGGQPDTIISRPRTQAFCKSPKLEEG